MNRSPILALFALTTVALAGCGGGAGKTTTTTTAARRGSERRDSSPLAQPPSSSLPYEQRLLPFHAALDAAERRRLTETGATEIPVHLKKPGTLSAFGQAQLGLSIVRVANAASVESAGGTANLDLRLTPRARDFLAKGRAMLMYVAIKFSGSPVRQQLTVPLHG